MRVIIPSDIKKLIKMQEPYLHYDKKSGFTLRADAPKEVVEAREKAKAWMRENEQLLTGSEKETLSNK